MAQIDDLASLQTLYPETYEAILATVRPFVDAARDALGTDLTEDKVLFVVNAAKNHFQEVATGTNAAADYLPGYPGSAGELVDSVILPALPELVRELWHERP
jgi:hypothetical protein